MAINMPQLPYDFAHEQRLCLLLRNSWPSGKINGESEVVRTLKGTS